MKKIAFLLLAALASFVSCKEQPSMHKEYVEVTVNADASASRTRAVLTDKTESGYPVFWTLGTQVGFYAGSEEAVWARPSTPGATTTFSVSLPDVSEGRLVALSPKSADGTSGGFSAYSVSSLSLIHI